MKTPNKEGSGKRKSQKKGKCFLCDKKGHWKKECLDYLNKKKVSFIHFLLNFALGSINPW